MNVGLIAIGAGICMLAAALAGLGMGLATGRAVDAVARQPEATGKINSVLILGLALTESTAIYGFVTALIMIFTMKG
ncbi:MAG: ATP synthase F0 subunit C [Clostridiales bacterium]|nr:MAG: ATP synthase F0 subunit C [Clostridiales bacterium]